MTIQRVTGEPEGVPVDQLLSVHAAASRFYGRQVATSWVPGHLEARGLAAALQPDSGWQIGHAPAGWTTLTDHLCTSGYGDDVVEASGLALRARTGRLVDRFRDRLILPIRDEQDRVIAFVARAHPDVGERTPKYLNSPTTALYSKGDHLLAATGVAPRIGITPVIVEGPLDAVAVAIASPDRHLPLALCGTTLTTVQSERVSRLAGGIGAPVVVATDADDAGVIAAVAAYRRLTAVGLQTWAANLSPGFDPAELLSTRGGALRLRSRLTDSARPLIDAVVDSRVGAWNDKLRWIEGKVGLVRDVAPYLAVLPADQLDRQVQRVSGLVGVDPDTTRREVDRARGRPVRQSAALSAISISRARLTVARSGTAALSRPAVHRTAAR